LLVDRASAVDRGFQIDGTNAELVARLCRRLDGIPLAIELAAARLRVLSLRQIVERLDDRFSLLSSGPRLAEPRHQTLRALIDWSYELCSPDERVLWARMSVFEASCDLEAVEAVCAETGASVFDAVAGLVDKSILVPEEAAGRVRYRMLESVRDYGRQRLEGRGEADWVKGRHREYFVELVGNLELLVFGPERRSLLARTPAELPDLRSALDRCLASPDTHADAVTLSSSIWWHWVATGALDEGLRWADRTLSGHLESTTENLHALGRASWLAWFSGDLARVRSYAERAHALAVADESSAVHYRLRSNDALLAFIDGDLDRAMELDREPMDRALHDGRFGAEFAVMILVRSAIGLAWTGHSREALPDIEQALALCEKYGDEWHRAHLLSLKSACLCDLDHHAEALDSARDALRLARGFNAVVVVNSIEVAAHVSAMMGEGTTAAVLLGAASTLRPGMGSSLMWGDRSRLGVSQQRASELLGEAGYSAAYERGRSMSAEQAVSFVIGEPPAASVRTEGRSDAATSPLSRREAEVAELIARGLSNKEISAALVISPRTAEGHVARLFDKLGFTSRARVAAWVAEQRASGPSAAHA
jgi:DNA-binding CsgD family transcriptional regulator